MISFRHRRLGKCVRGSSGFWFAGVWITHHPRITLRFDLFLPFVFISPVFYPPAFRLVHRIPLPPSPSLPPRHVSSKFWYISTFAFFFCFASATSR